MLDKFNISENYKTVLVKPKDKIYFTFDSPYLMGARFDLNERPKIDKTARSVLFDSNGKVILVSKNNIALLSKFYSEQNEFNKDTASMPSDLSKDIGSSKNYAPMENTIIEILGYGGFGGGVTDKSGKYTGMFMLAPCPCFAMEYTIPVTAKYYYSQFTSKGVKPFYDYQIRNEIEYCSGYDACPIETSLVGAATKTAIIGLYASMPRRNSVTNFFIDSGFIAGEGVLQNPNSPVLVSNAESGSSDDRTIYSYTEKVVKYHKQDKYDFDGDNEYDISKIGKLVNGRFECLADNGNEEQSKGEYQGVYFSSSKKKICDIESLDNQPDLIRLKDKKSDQHQGLLEKISKRDLQDTDILVFRESTGMLITHRSGLPNQSMTEEEIKKGDLPKNNSFYGVHKDSFRFQIMIRGPIDGSSKNVSVNGEESFSKFQSSASMNPSLHERKSDHLKPGEPIKIVLINRKTGYIGTQSTIYNNNFSVALNFAKQNIVMRPPNLKISAVRRHKITEGLTKGNSLQSLIAYEGAALSNDEQIILTTEWYDENNEPLPQGLADFGYTGRVAQITSTNKLSLGGGIGHFAIKPGKHIVHINLPDNSKRPEHFYVQVSGQPIYKPSDFSQIGAAEQEPLKFRPKHYVPFLVPFFDENLTLERAWLFKKLEEDLLNNDSVIDFDTLEKPSASYKWLYRPELQFSTYEFNAKGMLRQNSEGKVIDIFNKNVPMISDIDNLIQFTYKLIENSLSALPFLDIGQELVFALGEAELRARIGANDQLEFTNLEHLSNLDVEDFVTMRLYNNNDPSNILWQYAFETLFADVAIIGADIFKDDGSIFISADEPELPLIALIPGYQNRQNKSPVNVTWSVEGAGQITKIDTSLREEGVFRASIVMPKVAGSIGVAVAQLGTDSDNKIKLPPITVEPGKPKTITLQASSAVTYIAGHKPIRLRAIVKDAHGNNVADRTPINFSIEGQAKIITNATEISGGEAEIIFAGDQAPDAAAKVKIEVQGVSAEYPFVVNPLIAVISSYPRNMEPKTESPILVTVTEDGTNAVPNVDVVFGSNGGKFKEQVIKTNGSGVAEAILHSGYYPIERLEISARVGMVPATQAQLQVRPKALNYADSRETLLIGDATSSGETQYTREDGLLVRLPYTANGYIQLKGEVGHQMPLQLGSMFEPNLQPIAAYAMKEVEDNQVEELNQLHPGTARHVQASLDNPNGTGQSYLFNAQAMQNVQGVFESSAIEVPASERFRRPDSIGFRVNVKLNAVGGSIFNLEGGAQQLLVNDDGRLVYQLWTATGQHRVQSAPLTVGQWYTVAGRYFNGTLELAVEGLSHDQTTASGTLKYGASQRGLSIGEDFSGHLVSLKFYDWTGAPLMTFADGSTSITHQMQTAHDRVEVISTGSMNQQGEQAGMLRIGLTADGQQTFVGVISKAHFTELSKFQLETNGNLKYPPLTTAYQQQMTPWPLMGVANAGFGDWIAENALDVLKAAVGFMIPYEDGISLVKQLYYFGFDKDQFDVTELVLSALGVVTGIPLPFTKIFAPLVGPLKTVLRSLKLVNPRFFTAMGGLMTKIIDELKNKRYDTIYAMAPMLLVMGEMVADAEARQGFMLLVKSISSVDDLLVWANYFSLPADGWEGETAPPPVALRHDNRDELDGTFNIAPFMGKAYAKKTNDTSRRIAGAVIGRELAELMKNSTNKKELIDNLTKAIESISDAALKAKKINIRNLVFTDDFVNASVAILKSNKGKLSEMINGGDNERINPLILLMSIAFLENEIDSGALFKNSTTSRHELLSLYMDVFTRHKSRFEGSSFHIVMLAYYHAQHKYMNKPRVIEIESVNSVSYEKYKYDRETDIELEGYKLIEVKSKSVPFKSSELKLWQRNINNKNKSVHLHKEFLTDFIIENTSPSPEGERYKAIWRFQKFKVIRDKKIIYEGPKNRNDLKPIEKLCTVPKELSNDWLNETTGKTRDDLENNCLNSFYDRVDFFDAYDIFKDFSKPGQLFGDHKNNFFKDISEELMRNGN